MVLTVEIANQSCGANGTTNIDAQVTGLIPGSTYSYNIFSNSPFYGKIHKTVAERGIFTVVDETAKLGITAPLINDAEYTFEVRTSYWQVGSQTFTAIKCNPPP